MHRSIEFYGIQKHAVGTTFLRTVGIKVKFRDAAATCDIPCMILIEIIPCICGKGSAKPAEIVQIFIIYQFAGEKFFFVYDIDTGTACHVEFSVSHIQQVIIVAVWK